MKMLMIGLAALLAFAGSSALAQNGERHGGYERGGHGGPPHGGYERGPGGYGGPSAPGGYGRGPGAYAPQAYGAPAYARPGYGAPDERRGYGYAAPAPYALPGGGPRAGRGFVRGQFLPPGYGGGAVADPRIYHLRRPPNGYSWVTVGPNAYLTQRSTGLILDTAPLY